MSLTVVVIPRSLRVVNMSELGLAWLSRGDPEQALVELKSALKLAKEVGFNKPARRIMALIESIDEEELLRQWTRSNRTKALKIETTARKVPRS